MKYKVQFSMEYVTDEGIVFYGDWNPKKTDRIFSDKKSAQKYLQKLTEEIPSKYFRVKYNEDSWDYYEDFVEDFIVERTDNYVVMSNEWWVKFGTPQKIRVEIIEIN